MRINTLTELFALLKTPSLGAPYDCRVQYATVSCSTTAIFPPRAYGDEELSVSVGGGARILLMTREGLAHRGNRQAEQCVLLA